VALSAPGIGSNLDINSIISQLMAVESRPLTRLAMQEASFQSKLTALGSLKGALSTFQGAASGLNNLSKFQSMSASSSDGSIATASATSKASPGSYSVHVSQLSQAQTLVSSGRASSTATIGTGTATTLSFQFGAIDGGTFVSTSSKLSSGTAANGIPANALTINGTTITTDSSVTSAKLLAEKINLAASNTGVTATAAATDSGAMGAFTTIGGDPTYSLDVGGVNIISGAAAGTDAAAIDARLADTTVAGNLSAAGISFTGTAANGDLRFTRADGSNIAIQESGAGATGGFTATVGIGKTVTHTSSVSLSAASAITVGGANPGAAGFVAGVQPNTYSGASFTQNPDIAGGKITIDATNNTLQGIRDAINNAKIGVTATIVADGSSNPYRLVITSDKTGANSSMKISASGDAAVGNLLAYDPAGTQNMLQTSVAQDSMLSVNGVAIRSAKTEISDAIQGVTLNLSKTGSTTVNIARDTIPITDAVKGFVKAYNDLNKTLSNLTAYNPETRQGATLVGDSTVRSIQSGMRRLLSAEIGNAAGNLKHLSEIGVSFQKDGTLALDSSKLQKAVTDNIDDIGALFATFGKSSDSLVSFKSSSTATKPGAYEVFVTALATQGKTVGSDPAALSITQGVNDQLSVTINGVSATLVLTAGDYTLDSLTSHLQSAINGNSTLSDAGAAVAVSADANGILTITSNTYGSASRVGLSGSAADALLGAGRVSTGGTDITGTIGGAAATGSGQDLIGAAGSPVDGLRLTITGGPENAARGTLNFSHGYAQQLSRLVDSYLGTSGRLTSRTEGLNSSIKDLGRQRDAISRQLEAVEKRYRAQFTALDAMISSMNQTSQYLSQQLANLPKIE
jgi:flagellar hook-associated protein 2